MSLLNHVFKIGKSSKPSTSHPSILPSSSTSFEPIAPSPPSSNEIVAQKTSSYTHPKTPSTPASFFYDNGTGELEPYVVHQLESRAMKPLRVQTNSQPVSFVPPSSNQYTCVPSYGSSTAIPLMNRSAVLYSAPQTRGVARPNLYGSTAYEYPPQLPVGSIWSALNGQYIRRVQCTTLKTKTRTSKWQGSWLSTGTLRAAPGKAVHRRDRRRSKDRNSKSKLASKDDSVFKETSGWYD